MKLISLIMILSLAGCATNDAYVERERGKFFASVYVLESDYGGEIKGKTGFEFYINEPKGVVGPLLNGYRYKGGKLVETFDDGSGAAETVHELRKVNLQSYDYSAEVESALEKARKEEPLLILVTLHGSRWDIKVATDSGDLHINEWNPGGDIKYLSKYSDNLAKTEQIINILARYYGRYHMGP